MWKSSQEAICAVSPTKSVDDSTLHIPHFRKAVLMMTVGFIVIAFVFAMVIRARKADQNYTIGSGLYKDSDYNLEKQRHADACDYNYYNDTDKLK